MGRDRDLLLGVMGAGSRYFEIVNDSLESALFLGRIYAIQRKNVGLITEGGLGGRGLGVKGGGRGSQIKAPA